MSIFFFSHNVFKSCCFWCVKMSICGVKGYAENIVGKAEIACYEQFLLFPQCFQKQSVVDAFKLVSMEWKLTLSETSPGFYVCSTSLLKTLWEKEKLLVTSNFSFSHSVFYPFGGFYAIFIIFKTVVCNLFQFGRVGNLSLGKKLMYLHIVAIDISLSSQWRLTWAKTFPYL